MKPILARFLPAVCLLAGLPCVWASVARAQEPSQQAVAKVTELNKKALEVYDNLEPEEARKLLMQALEVCASSGMNNHVLKARTHVHLGVVLMGGFKQRDLAIKQFKRALEVQPDIKLTKSLVNPETQAAFDQAKAEMGGGEKAEEVAKEATKDVAKEVATPEPSKEVTRPSPSGRDEDTEAGATDDDRPPRKFKGVFHHPVTEARANEAIVIKAAVASDLDFTKVILAYRPEGATDYLQRPMRKDDKGWYTARIPEAAAQSGLVSYYIEARTNGDKEVAANGSAAEPHVVSVSAGDGSAVAAQGDDEAAPKPAKHKRAAPALVEDAEPAEAGGVQRSIWIGLGIGFGYGWFKGDAEVNHGTPDTSGNPVGSQSGTGLATLLHLAPEIGFQLSPTLAVSIEGRLQIITGATTVYADNCPNKECSPSKGAIAVVAKVKRYLSTGTLRPFVAGALGGGEIRHTVKLSQTLSGCGGSQNADGICTDTVNSGPVLFGGGAGLAYGVGGGVDLVVSATLLIGVPRATANVDLNGGLALGF